MPDRREPATHDRRRGVLAAFTRSTAAVALSALALASCAPEAPPGAPVVAIASVSTHDPASDAESAPASAPDSADALSQPTKIESAIGTETEAEKETGSPAAAESAGPTAAATTAAPSVPEYARAAPLGDSKPVRLRIPAIGVDSSLIRLGLRADRTLQVPPRGFPAGWYTGSPTPGELGPAIVAGHVDWSGERGVFYDLRRLTPGDTVTVDRQDGSTAIFRVSRVQRFAKDEFPTKLVYGDIGWAGLRLITCGGTFDRKARSYVDNIVVFADLVGTS